MTFKGELLQEAFVLKATNCCAAQTSWPSRERWREGDTSAISDGSVVLPFFFLCLFYIKYYNESKTILCHP